MGAEVNLTGRQKQSLLFFFFYSTVDLDTANVKLRIPETALQRDSRITEAADGHKERTGQNLQTKTQNRN